ncbi:hypothetical protein [Nonomuraea sp. NPDC050202]|uniref:hypothetical protein n=1 Tax=Nonomuraea sp. NPDC050202 TaxID=3155035 RepID=UPI0033D141FC
MIARYEAQPLGEVVRGDAGRVHHEIRARLRHTRHVVEDLGHERLAAAHLLQGDLLAA